nr:phytoene desaturase family protein [Microbacterium sp. SYP-A9085]
MLARSGYDVTLLEARDQVGGRAGSWEKAGFRFDTGPSWYLMPEVFDHFFHLMGTRTPAQLDLQLLDPGYRVLFQDDDLPVDVRSGRRAVTDLFERIEPGAGLRLVRYLDSAADTYRLALDSFLYTTFAAYRPLVTRAVLARATRLPRLLREPLDSFVARSFADRRLRQILGYPAVFLGSAPHLTPSLYHLMSHLDLDQGVWYPIGGIARVIERIRGLAVGAGVVIRTGVTATAIETITRSGKARVTGVRIEDVAGRAETVAADCVVSTADLHHTETALLPRRLQTYPERWWEKRSPGPGAVVVCLGVTGELPQLAHHTLLFTKDWEDNFAAIFHTPTAIPRPASMYVCRPSATDPTVAPDGCENLFLLVPVPADVTIGHGGESGGGDPVVERVADDAVEQIAAWADIPDLRERIVVRRTAGPADFADELNAWRGGALGPAHTLRQSAFLRGRNASAKIEGLFYAGGSTIPGIGLPMCLISAELVIKRLRADTSTRPLKEPL